jgi:glycosyltransferase involved in cell wall biosynthesis
MASDSMPGYYNELDALVVPSRTKSNWKEQFGRVLIEAMACGVPVIGSDSGEIPNVIGDAGQVFPEGNAHALRRQISRLLEDEIVRRDHSHRGRNRVLVHFAQASIAAQTYQVYQEILDARGSVS